MKFSIISDQLSLPSPTNNQKNNTRKIIKMDTKLLFLKKILYLKDLQLLKTSEKNYFVAPNKTRGVFRALSII